jgi:hypothetical protein
VNHDSARGLAGRFLRSKGMRIRGVYMMLAKDYMGKFLVKEGS